MDDYPNFRHFLRIGLFLIGVVKDRSNDNAFAESIFKTVKYCPEWPSQGFLTLDESRQWMLKFERFYNNKHRHSSIRFVTPAQRHEQRDAGILKHRKQVYTKAQEANPSRWSGDIRNWWEPVGAVALNPERLYEVDKHGKQAA